MKIKRVLAALCAISALCSASLPAIAAQAQQGGVKKVETTLSADSIDYNVNTGDARASGNVVIKREGATLWGDEAEGNTNDEVMTLRGNVRGEFPEQDATLKSESATWTGDKSKRTDGLVEAFGSVRLTRGAEDYLNADYVRWEPGTENYAARGGVDGLLEKKILKADDARRSGNKFWATGVRRYEDLVEKFAVSARTVEGTLAPDPQTGQDALKDMVADRNVVLDYVDREGLKTRVTGDRAVYSKARGTIVVSGNTKAVRSDGKTVTADTMVVHEDTRVIEAKGNSRIIFVVDEEEQPADQKKDGGKNAKKSGAPARSAEKSPETGGTPKAESGAKRPSSGSESTLSDDETRWVEGW
ncbi:LPS export ABC transporter periplasmic protein LptC [Cloacibacillus sp. An23]|uniref:LptA/OstA family protein n=1 Tax=Cloacibacillus sp. An23 TaxID=1965591 RepID=UPI000B3A0F35|nr:LPS export ABC transporter periplasmic protein LptC [Cloacibacillus sp. An23]OUO92957.1 hypothetical protein B5F39_08870 [Cloacibacillus sp. An23]